MAANLAGNFFISNGRWHIRTRQINLWPVINRLNLEKSKTIAVKNCDFIVRKYAVLYFYLLNGLRLSCFWSLHSLIFSRIFALFFSCILIYLFIAFWFSYHQCHTILFVLILWIHTVLNFLWKYWELFSTSSCIKPCAKSRVCIVPL